MLEHYIEYDKATGAVVYTATVNAGTMALQTVQPGRALLAVPYAALKPGTNDLDLGIIKGLLLARIDLQAGATRRPYLTSVEGQDLTYIYKAAEARAFALDPASPTPFITEEATQLGVPVQTVVDEVLTAIGLWTEIGKRIEGRRRAANVAVGAAASIAEALVAGDIDWSDLRAPAA